MHIELKTKHYRSSLVEGGIEIFVNGEDFCNFQENKATGKVSGTRERQIHRT